MSIDSSTALAPSDDVSVHGDPLTGTHEDDVADRDVLETDLGLVLASDHAGRAGRRAARARRADVVRLLARASRARRTGRGR